MSTSTRSVRPSTGMWRRVLATAAVLATTGSALTVASQPAQAALPPQQIADPVHYWNDVLLQVIRREGGGPGPMSRSAAMLNAAIYDAESSYQLKWKGRITSEPYISAHKYDGWVEGPDEEERVIGRTAYNILLGLYGERQTRRVERLTVQLHGERRQVRCGLAGTGQRVQDLDLAAVRLHVVDVHHASRAHTS